MISVADQPTVEKPPEYDTVVILDPPCYDEAIKLNPANLLHTKYYQDVLLPNYAELEITGSIHVSNCSRSNVDESSDNGQNGVITTRNGTNSSNNINNSISQANNQNSENVTNSCNPSTAITIEQTASDLTNEHSITRKSNDNDSVASESSAMS